MILLGLSRTADPPSTGQGGDVADRGTDRMARAERDRRSGGRHGRQDYPAHWS